MSFPTRQQSALFLLLITLLVSPTMLGCSAGSGNPTGPLSQGADAEIISVVLNSDEASNRVAKLVASDGTEIDIWGQRDVGGNITEISDMQFTTSDGRSAYVQVDAFGRPMFSQDELGYAFRVNDYLSDNLVDVTYYAPDGASARVVVDLSKVLEDSALRAKTLAKPDGLHGLSLRADCSDIEQFLSDLCAIWSIRSALKAAGCVVGGIIDLIDGGPTALETILGCAIGAGLGGMIEDFLCDRFSHCDSLTDSLLGDVPPAPDFDQDGILDSDDLCPNTFSPAPQIDTDGDGLGDQCDPTPLGGGEPPDLDDDQDDQDTPAGDGEPNYSCETAQPLRFVGDSATVIGETGNWTPPDTDYDGDHFSFSAVPGDEFVVTFEAGPGYECRSGPSSLARIWCLSPPPDEWLGVVEHVEEWLVYAGHCDGGSWLNDELPPIVVKESGTHYLIVIPGWYTAGPYELTITKK